MKLKARPSRIMQKLKAEELERLKNMSSLDKIAMALRAGRMCTYFASQNRGSAR